MNNKEISFFQLAKKGLNDWWLYVVTILLTIFGYMLGEMPMFIVLSSKMKENPEIGEEQLKTFYETMDFGLFGISSNFGFMLMLTFFIFALAGLFFGLRLHKKNLKDIITPKSAINYNKILFGFGFWFVLTLLFELIAYLMNPSAYVFRFEMGSFAILLIITLIFIPLQSSFEELFFRGYLLQAIGLLSKNKWVALVATTLLFSLVHSANPEIEKFGFWTMQFYYIGAGLFLGWITIMDDSLELALGVHAATNIFGASIVSYEGSVLQTGTLFKTSAINPWMMTMAFYLSAVIFTYVCYKKYNWGNFKKILTPIDYDNVDVSSTNPNIARSLDSDESKFTDQNIKSNTDYSSLLDEENDN